MRGSQFLFVACCIGHRVLRLESLKISGASAPPGPLLAQTLQGSRSRFQKQQPDIRPPNIPKQAEDILLSSRFSRRTAICESLDQNVCCQRELYSFRMPERWKRSLL